MRAPVALLVGLAALAAWTIVTDAAAQGTSFGYQGRLNDGTVAANGSYDLTFALFDSSSAGKQVGVTDTNLAVNVSGGLFAATLDFGTGVFNGAPYWLEIGVRPSGNGEFTTLTPRQPVMATPYALFAPTAGTVPNGAITAAKLAAGAAAANLQAGGQSAVGGGGVVLSEQANAPELLGAGYLKIGRASLIDESWLARASGPTGLGPAPLARTGHSAVWTGSELIIWGGRDATGLVNTGARYNPIAGLWTRLSTSNAPTARAGHRAVWTGSEMIIWGGTAGGVFGGSTTTNTGARYNPATDTWTAIAPGGGSRQNHTAFWTGTEMIVWGGTVLSSGLFGPTLVPRVDGARYNLAANTWTGLPQTGAPGQRQDYSAVFTGTEMIIWGGRDSFGTFIATSTNFNDGARYNLAANTWAPVQLTGAPFRRSGHSAVWSGSEMIVWGGQYAEGDAFSLVTSNYNNGGRYNPSTDSWTPLPTAGAPMARSGHDAVWAGTRMVIWGGTDGTNLFNSGARYFPAANSWSNMTFSGGPVARSGHTTVWSGSEMIVWGGFDGAFVNNGGRYNPGANTWSGTATAGAPAIRSGAAAVWTGTEMLVWGGVGGTIASPFALGTGGRYNPAANSWATLPTVNAPVARTAHRAVWTGEEMLVWGGTDLTSELNSGGRYHRGSNTWAMITTNNAPSPRTGHTGVWDGTRLIVWGGLQGDDFLPSGGIYNPLTDAWLATLAGTNAPGARALHVAVWTGTEMVVHGGYESHTMPDTMSIFDDTWHYTPPRTMFLYLKP